MNGATVLAPVLIFPVDQEKFAVRRLPWVGMAIIAVFLTTQALTTLVGAGRVSEARALAVEIQELQDRIVVEHGRGSGKRETVLRDFRAGKLSEPNNALLVRLHLMERRLGDARYRVPVLMLGYRPAVDGRERMVTSAFVHDGWLALLLNALFLYLVASNLEHRVGRVQFLLLFLTGAVISAFAFRLQLPGYRDFTAGATGAVAAAVGGFAGILARERIRFIYLNPFARGSRMGRFEIRALWVLPFFGVAEVLHFLLLPPETASAAVPAHGAAFAAGAGFALIYRLAAAARAATVVPVAAVPVPAGTPVPAVPGPVAAPAPAGTAAVFEGNDRPTAAVGAPAVQTLPAEGDSPAPDAGAAGAGQGGERRDAAAPDARPPPKKRSKRSPADALFESAMKLKRQNKTTAALKKFQTVLLKDPNHRTGHQAVVELIVTLPEREEHRAALKRSAEWLVSHLFAENDHSRVISFFKRLDKNGYGGVLRDRVLMQVVRSAREMGSVGAVTAATVVMVREYPDSDLAPRALWTTAEMQERAGRDDLAFRTLEGLIESYPSDPFAEHARNRLETEYDADDMSISLPPPDADDDDFFR
jgi:membrane associated rhomboid family serine protease/outer membrane protein assembly factor BamD (BamD/ComL family)